MILYWKNIGLWIAPTLLVVMLLPIDELSAQDPVFSQPNATPLWVNPALAGAGHYIRGNIGYRTQWSAVSKPFTTTTGSFDMLLNQNANRRKMSRGKPGIGISFLSDRAGEPSLKTTRFDITGAYHVNLNKNSSLGAGFSLGYVARSLDVGGKWGSQYNGSAYDPDLPHGENLAMLQQSALNIGGGVVYNFREKTGLRDEVQRRELTIGIAGYHLGQMSLSNEDVYSGKDAIRISAMANGLFSLGRSRSSILPAIYYQRQGASQMLMGGMAYRNQLKSSHISNRNSRDVAFGLGVYYRFSDAVIAQLFIEWAELSVYFAYDITTSKLSKYVSGRGAVEIGIAYKLPAPIVRW